MTELGGTRVFEVDRRDTQASKRARVGAAAELGVRTDVSYVTVDFARDDLAARLAAAGWDRSRPSIVVWEGVTNYLDEAAVADVLRFVGGTSPGTTLIFTYIHRGVLDGSVRFEGADKLVRNVRRLGEPWTFGLHPDEVSDFVARFGLRLEEDLGADAYRRRYLGDDDRTLSGYGFYRLAVTRVVA